MDIYLVGGAVRDMVMGVEPKDRDYVVVGATHEDMMEAGYQKVGADFPVYLDDLGQEYALARTERSTGKGYNDFVTDFNPRVTLEEDLKRRDFTMNAMALNFNGVVVDPYGGQKDIKAGVINVVNEHAFHEDPVRAFRACRFGARYDMRLSEMTIECIDRCIEDGRMAHLTTERIWKEYEKAFGPKFSEFIFLTKVTGVDQALGYNLEYGNLRYLRQADPLLQFASVALASDMAPFYKVAKVPSDYKKFAMIAAKFFVPMKEKIDHNADYSSIVYHMLNATKDKFREELFELIDLTHWVDLNDVFRFTKEKLKKIEKAFDSVTSEQYSGISGPELGKAIQLGRIEAIKAAMR
ncbi:hypothetical protein [Aeromonas phage phiWae14]|nr:hypothetical protein [Aeromonas phage phiWae14]